MVWHRLMTYAHENVDLKPIPGIDNPFVDAQVVAKAEEKQKKQKTGETQLQRHRAPAGALRLDHQGAARHRRHLQEFADHRRAARAGDAFRALAAADRSAGSRPSSAHLLAIQPRRALSEAAHPDLRLQSATPMATHAENRLRHLRRALHLHRRRRRERLVHAEGQRERRRRHHRRLDRLSRHRHAGRRPLFQGARRPRGPARARPRRRPVLLGAARFRRRGAAARMRLPDRGSGPIRRASGRSTPPTPPAQSSAPASAASGALHSYQLHPPRRQFGLDRRRCASRPRQLAGAFGHRADDASCSPSSTRRSRRAPAPPTSCCPRSSRSAAMLRLVLRRS